jgi:hypothetical protein
LALSVSAAAEAQGFVVTGTVGRVADADTTALSNRWILLHSITLEGGTPLDSALSDRRGRYTFRIVERDSLAAYLVSVEHQGIGYFSEAVRPQVGALDTLPRLLVYDTSSTGPQIALSERHILVRNAEADGSRRVVELFVLANRGSRTRIAGSDSGPVWSGRIPRAALQFEIGLSDMSEEAIQRTGDTLAVFSAVPPGERQLLVGYLLPRGARELVVPVDQHVDRFAVLLEDSSATVESGSLTATGVADLGGTPVRRFEAQDIEAGAAATVLFPRTVAPTTTVSWFVVPLVALGFLVVFHRWRRRQAAPVRVAEDDPASLAAEIAALDAAHANRKTEAYRGQRAVLKERLQRALDPTD